MSAPLYLLPWLRRGLGLVLGEPDDTETRSLTRGAPVAVSVYLDGVEAAVTLSMRPADHATAIDATQIIRRYPEPNTVDAEYGYFPLVELSAPDLPWVLTPVVADDSTGRLRPWIVLVCVEDATAELVPADGDRPARLIVPVDQLPDLTESYAWAHVQSIVPTAQVVGSLGEPGSVLSRLVCPRRLAANRRYRAAVVAAFSVSAGGDQLVDAWDLATGEPAMPELTVYTTWTFTTGEAGSFEELCKRLGPVGDEELQLGLHTLDVTHVGPIDPWPPGTGRVTVDYTGALWDADLDPRTLGSLNDDFDSDVTTLLEEGSHRVTLDLDDPDPVVTPPLFGSFAAGTHLVPAAGWMRQLNLGPNRRAAAGLGAEIVRIHQERFMAAAWQQAGALRETNRELSTTRLQAEIGRTWLERTNRLHDLPRVTVLRSQLSFVRDADGQAPRHLLAESTIPNALASPAYLRHTRPGSVVAAAAAGRSEGTSSWRSAVALSFGSAATRRLMHFAEVGRPEGMVVVDPRRTGDDWIPDDFDDEIPEDMGLRELTSGDLDLADVAALTTTGIRPVATARARIEARIPALTGLLAAAPYALPTRVRWGPVIDEALVWSLIELSPELLLPGVGQFPPNSVRLVEANPAFVSSFLAGANHEMSRELLWREFPADMGSTTFRRFWDRPGPDGHDIIPMAEWVNTQTLGGLGQAGGESVVLLIRGDLVMHYPTVRVLLVDPDTGVASLPSFSGWIPPDVRFAAFDVDDPDAVTEPGSQWQVVLEEQPCEPRFGLDTGTADDELILWSDLTWQHIGQSDVVHLIVGDTGFPADRPEPDGATWGLNSAHMARAVYQAPFRQLFRVVDLVGSPS